MSRVDTRSIADAYLGGAGLATQQFGLISGLAQRAREMERLKGLDAFARENALADNARQDAHLTLAQGNAAREMERLKNIDAFARENALADNARQDAYLTLAQGNAAREKAEKQARAAVFADYARTSLASTRAMRPSLGHMAGPGASTLAQGTIPGVGAMLATPAPDPEDDRWAKLIDLAESKGDEHALQWLAAKGETREGRARANRWFRMVEEKIGDDAGVLAKPEERAAYSLFKESGDVEGMSRWLVQRAAHQQDAQDALALQQQKAGQQQAVMEARTKQIMDLRATDWYAKLPPERRYAAEQDILAGRDITLESLTQPKPMEDRFTATRASNLVADAEKDLKKAQEEYEAVNVKGKDKLGLAPPTKEEFDLAHFKNEGSGKTKAAAEAKVKAWYKMKRLEETIEKARTQRDRMLDTSGADAAPTPGEEIIRQFRRSGSTDVKALAREMARRGVPREEAERLLAPLIGGR